MFWKDERSIYELMTDDKFDVSEFVRSSLIRHKVLNNLQIIEYLKKQIERLEKENRELKEPPKV